MSEAEKVNSESSHKPEKEPVWTFRGYQLKPSEFTTALVHLFRAEINRSNVWRQRLDATTNWAVITTGAAITLAFNQTGHHTVIILNTLLVTLFLFIEARRYRYYELWSYRVRLMETDFYAAMLVPPFKPAADWAESLAENLLHPDFPISMWEAFGRRLRRNFMWIYIILDAAWLARTWLLPESISSWNGFIENASIGAIPGSLVLILGVIFNILLFLTGFFTLGLHQASGEVLPRYTAEPGGAVPVTPRGQISGEEGAWFRKGRRRRQLMALIITDQAEGVSQVILDELERGVTALEGRGMYTKEAHSLLLCALTITEVNNLKSLVKKKDPNAFVIVSPAQEILGAGFMPLEPRE